MENKIESGMPHQEKNNEVIKKAFNTLKERMNGRDLMLKDSEGEDRFYVISSPAGTINLHSYDTGLTYTMWEDGDMETSDDSDEKDFFDEPTEQELMAMIYEIKGLREEEMKIPEE